MNMEYNLGAPTCPIELVPNLGAAGGYSLPPYPIGRLRVLAASQVSMGRIITDDELLLACYDLYLKYSKAGKQELKTLFLSFQGKVYQSDAEELDDDDIKERILLKALQQHKKKQSIAPHLFSPSLEASILENLGEFYDYHIRADGLSWSELMYCRGDRSDEEIVTGLFYWVLQHPTCFSGYISTLPTPVLLCKKPMTALSTEEDWLQAIFELAYGYSSPFNRVLAAQIIFYEGQSRKERDKELNDLIGEYTLKRLKLLEQRNRSNTENEELWLINFIYTLQVAVQRAIPVSLMEFVRCNRPPNWDLMKDLWMDAVDGKAGFITPVSKNYHNHPASTQAVSDKFLTQEELAQLKSLFSSTSKEARVLEKFVCAFGECVRYEDLQVEIWGMPRRDATRPYNNAEKSVGNVDKGIKKCGFHLERYKVNKKVIGRILKRSSNL
ncbi:MAG: hypothetical protein K0Q50_1159 [Vampirovibrio sp.]|jgi:hypothetical protein|nr:hypothetical protein [Vampirovibrio sp.]